MASTTILLKDGVVYAVSQIRNSLGLSSPKGPIKVLGHMADLNAFTVGTEAIAAMQQYDGQILNMDSDEPKEIERTARQIGFKGYSDFQRNALLVFCYESDDGAINVCPSKRHGQRSPAFAFFKSMIPASNQPSDVGKAIIQAFEKCR